MPSYLINFRQTKYANERLTNKINSVKSLSPSWDSHIMSKCHDYILMEEDILRLKYLIIQTIP